MVVQSGRGMGWIRSPLTWGVASMAVITSPGRRRMTCTLWSANHVVIDWGNRRRAQGDGTLSARMRRDRWFVASRGAW